MICTWTGFDHGQILIETATHSLQKMPLAAVLRYIGKSDVTKNQEAWHFK